MSFTGPKDRRFRAWECPRCLRQVFLVDPAQVLIPGDPHGARLNAVHALSLHMRVGCAG